MLGFEAELVLEARMIVMIAFVLGAAVAVASSVALAIAGFQWLTTFPFRWGWRRHAHPIGKAPAPQDAPGARLTANVCASDLDHSTGPGLLQ
ncbi:MAG TPA: hypothetical protein VF744_15275 [Beijerinckiaceae bacterium]|jgi:hypothetical protein